MQGSRKKKRKETVRKKKEREDRKINQGREKMKIEGQGKCVWR